MRYEHIKYMAKLSGLKQLAKTHCPRNHPYNEENTIRNKKGHRNCKKCKNLLQRKRYLQKTGGRSYYADL